MILTDAGRVTDVISAALRAELPILARLVFRADTLTGTLSKALVLMLPSELKSTVAERFLQPSKEDMPREKTLESAGMSVKAVHPVKALLPIEISGVAAVTFLETCSC